MIAALYTAQSGLRASKNAVEVTSNNIANENTKGYVKRTVNLNEKDSNFLGIGRGVYFDGAFRKTSKYLFSRMLKANSQSSYHTQKNNILSNAEIIFKETRDAGFSKTLNKFFSSIENLRSDSTSIAYSDEVKTQGKALVRNLQLIHQSLKKLQKDNLSSLETQVNKVNSILKQITLVNKKIRQDGQANDLLDKREQLESELSNYVDVDVSMDGGNYGLSIGGQSVIFNDTNNSKLNIKKEHIKQEDVYTNKSLSKIKNKDIVTIKLNNSATLNVNIDKSKPETVEEQIANAINKDKRFSKLGASAISGNLIIKSKNGGEDDTFDVSISYTASGSNTKQLQKDKNLLVKGSSKISINAYGQELKIASGSILTLKQGLTTQTSQISSYKKSLNNFAKTLVETYNDKSSTVLFVGSSVDTLSFNSNNVDSLTTSNLKDIAKIQYSNRITINSRTTSFMDFYNDLLIKVSSDVQSNKSNKEVQDLTLNSLQTSYRNLTGVDSDKEMENLVLYHAAYKANAKVITIVDKMLQTILNM